MSNYPLKDFVGYLAAILLVYGLSCLAESAGEVTTAFQLAILYFVLLIWFKNV